jgi:hypothetical protein
MFPTQRSLTSPRNSCDEMQMLQKVARCDETKNKKLQYTWRGKNLEEIT